MQSVDAHPFVQVVVVDLDGAIEGAGHACGDVLIAWTFERGPEFQPVSVSGVELDAGDRVSEWVGLLWHGRRGYAVSSGGVRVGGLSRALRQQPGVPNRDGFQRQSEGRTRRYQEQGDVSGRHTQFHPLGAPPGP